MELSAFVCWRPVGSCPIGHSDGIIQTGCLNINEITMILGECNCKHLLNSPQSIEISYASKLDGLFILTINGDSKIESAILSRIAKQFCDYVKRVRLAHSHDFHGNDLSASFFAHPNNDFLDSHPVKIRATGILEKEGISRCNAGVFLLRRLRDLEWDSTKHKNEKSVLALLKIRQQQMKKRKTCFQIITDFVGDKQSKSVAKSILMLLIFLAIYLIPACILVALFSEQSRNTQKVAYYISDNKVVIFSVLFSAFFLISAGLNYLNIYMVRIPILTLLRSTHGYFVYVNVYNDILKKYFKINEDISDYSTPIDAIKNRIEGEQQAMSSQQDIGRVMLALFGFILSLLTFYVSKLS